MNKSKFLKKSLAALLAVMLVVAMIPLSAAAAELPEYPLPNMTRLYINGNDVKLEDGVFAADIGSSDTSVTIRADSGSLTNAELVVVKPDSVTTTDLSDAATPTTVNFNTDATEVDGVVTLKLRMTHTGNKNSFKEFDVKLTRTTQGTTAELESATRIQSTGLYTASIGDHVINVTVARAAGEDTTTNPSITLKAKDNAKIYGTDVFDAADGTTAANDAAHAKNTVRVDKIADGNTITIVSQSGNNTAEWTFKVTKVDALESFSINGTAGVISDKLDNDDFSTTTPDNIVDTVTVSLDKDVFTDSLGNPVTSNMKLPVNFFVKGNVGKVIINTSKTATTAAPTTGTYKEVTAGSDYELATVPTVGAPVELALFVPSGTEAKASSPKTNYQKYILVVELKKSNNTAIESVTIMDEIATIDGEKIHAVLPDKEADGTTIDLTAIDDIEIVTDSSVTKVYMDSTTAGTNFFDDASPADNTPVAGKKTWSVKSSNKVNLSSPKIITVTAQNNEIQQYTISAEKDTNRTLAELNSITLQDPAGNNYTGTISGHKVTFSNIPYMTTSLADWKVFVEPNSSATAKVSTTTLINGTKQANLLFTDTVLQGDATAKKRTYTGATLCIENKNDRNVKTDYDTELVLVAPKTGKTLSSLTVSAQKADPSVSNDTSTALKNNVVYSKVTNANTVRAEIKEKFTDNTGTITLNQPFSLSKINTVSHIYDIVTDVATADGGVAYLGKVSSSNVTVTNDPTVRDKKGIITKLADDKKDFGSTMFRVARTGVVGTTPGTDTDLRVVVLPEEIARQVEVRRATNAGTVSINPTQLATGTVYTIEDKALGAEHAHDLTSIAVGDTSLRIEGDKIVGTLPYSLTTEYNADPTLISIANAKFLTFKMSGNFSYWNKVKNSTATTAKKAQANSDGMVDGVATAVGADNLKFIFTRNADHTVKVYTTDGIATDNAALIAKVDSADLANAPTNTANAFYIKAEDTLDANADNSTHKYIFDLKWADPNTEAKITSFSLAGRSGSISGQNVTVPVPYLTDVKGMIPTFTLSSGAKMELDDASAGLIESEKTTLDFSNPVKVIVTSEDGKHTEHYTITVTEGEMFTDVNSSHWFYEEVLKAATEGWINGRGDGTFDPYNTMTRADFANIIAKMQGFNADDYKDSRFADVPSSHYASAAIAFCADKEYIKGVGDNNFDPGANITREQAAAIICRVKGYAEESGNTSYGDDAKISGWAKGYVKAATTHQVMEGDGTNFNPQNNLLRCEGAATLVRSASK